MGVKTSEEVEENKEESKETEESKEESKGIDYEAELAKLKGDNEKLESVSQKQAGALREERKKRKELQEELKEESKETKEAEKPKETSGDVKDLIQKELDSREKSRVLDDIDDILDSVTNDPKERELIEEIYDKRIVPSGFSRKALISDIMDAKLMANKSKFMAEAEGKAKKSLAQKFALGSSKIKLNSQVEDNAESGDDELTREEQAFLKRFGVDPDKE